MQIAIHVDERQLTKAFKRAPIIVTTELSRWINRTAARTERIEKMELADNTDTGRLQSSVTSNFGILKAEVRPTAEHAIYVHEGRRPGKFPPFGERSSLGSWARRRGIEPFVVARAIAKRGIKKDPFADKTYRQVKPYAEKDAKDTLNDIVRKI